MWVQRDDYDIDPVIKELINYKFYFRKSEKLEVQSDRNYHFEKR